MKKPHSYAYVVVVLVVGAVAATVLTGTPEELPDVALGSDAMLHVERALVILLAILLVFVLIARAWKGELPNEISRDGFKYPSLDPKTVEDVRDAAELNVVSSDPERSDAPDSEGEQNPNDLMELRLRLEAKLSYIAKFLLRPEECDCATFVTVGSLNHDGFLTDREARTASQILTLRDEELDTLSPALRREFLRNASTVVQNLRASVFFGLVRTTLKLNKWEVEDMASGGKRRPDLLARKGDRSYRIVPRFVLGADPERVNGAKRRLAGSALSSLQDIIVLPDRTRQGTEEREGPRVMKFHELRKELELERDPRSLA